MMNFAVVVMWCGVVGCGVVVRAVGGGDMKIDVAVAPISCSGNFLTNHAAAWAGPGSTHPEAITSSARTRPRRHQEQFSNCQQCSYLMFDLPLLG